jgi:class 3 adenylate cyclase
MGLISAMGLLERKYSTRNPEITEFLRSLHVGSSASLQMERFQKGIDNLHVDVVLSHKFRSALSELVKKMVQEDLTKQGYSVTGMPLTNKDFDLFRDAYRGLLEGALQQINESVSVTDMVKLLQLTSLKVLLESPGMVIDELRRKLQKDADILSRDNSGRTLELHERLVFIAKHESGVRYRTLRQLFMLVHKVESKELRKIRKSILGISWVLPKQLLFNPLLHLPDLSTENYLMDHYPIICMDRVDERLFVTTNRIFCQLFKDYLPDWAQPVVSVDARKINKGEVEGFQVRQRDWCGGFSEFLDGHSLLEQSLQDDEFKTCKISWLDTPNNIDRLSHASVQSRRSSGLRGGEDHATHHIDIPDGMTSWQRILGEIHKAFRKAGILQRTIASYRTPRLYHQLKEQVPIPYIYQYLSGTLPRRNLLKKLGSLTLQESDVVISALDAVFHYIQRMSVAKQQEYVTRYLKDFLTFRRDLKLACFGYQQMSHIRLLKDPEDISLSRDNGTLYAFRLRSEAESSDQKIRAHVVLKADVRGSTEITHQLMRKRLNPATHFSLNFFGPINKLLERFNAQKVFVEGDAMILAVLEYGDSGQSLTVAYACGLACKILSVMESQNCQHLNQDLPKLELGLGIAFSDEAPAYLYDDQRKIMISPAINQADRLSSCTAELRHNTNWKRNKRHRVEVMHSSQDETSRQKLLRYNVNGIDLDPPAFKKLRTELAMHKIRLQSRSGIHHYYHVGRFIDFQGSSHWLVVREASIKTLRQDGRVIESQNEGDFFYEVITDSELIGRVKAKLRSRRKSGEGHAETVN